jgi:hypothetical protein
MINSRNKGKAAELEVASILKAHGFSARRGQQFKGTPDSPDVVCEDLDQFHVEVKRVEAGNLFNWMKKAIADAGTKIPLVIHRRSREPWVAILDLEDFLNLIKALKS